MLREALDFPTSGDRGSAALLVGSGLLLLSALVGWASLLVPPLLAVVLLLQLPLRGYYVRVLRATAAETEPTAPSFGDVGPLLRDGLVAVFVAFVYFLPALVLFAVAAGGNFAAAVENPLRLTDPTSIAAAETVGSLAALLGLFSSLASLYLVPGAVTLYAHDGRVAAAFHLRRVVRGTVSEDYAVGWVISLVLQLLLYPVVAALYTLLIGVVLHFLLAVAVRYVWGRSFGAAMSFEPTTVERTDITPDSGRLDTVATATTGDASPQSASTRAEEPSEGYEQTAQPATEPNRKQGQGNVPAADSDDETGAASRDPMADEGAN